MVKRNPWCIWSRLTSKLVSVDLNRCLRVTQLVPER